MSRGICIHYDMVVMVFKGEKKKLTFLFSGIGQMKVSAGQEIPQFKMLMTQLWVLEF